MTGTSLGITCTVDQHGQTGLDDRAGTHGAGFECNVHNAIEQSPVPQRLSSLCDGNHFSMGSRVVQLLTLIVGQGDDALVSLR